MALPNSSDIDNALIAKLASDAALLALCPNGVYYSVAAEGATQYVIVELENAIDVGNFGGTAYEDDLVRIEARMLSTVPGSDIEAAAQRIHELLQDQQLTVPGYTWMTTFRDQRIRLTDRDTSNPAVRMYRRGGFYRVQMSV